MRAVGFVAERLAVSVAMRVVGSISFPVGENFSSKTKNSPCVHVISSLCSLWLKTMSVLQIVLVIIDPKSSCVCRVMIRIVSLRLLPADITRRASPTRTRLQVVPTEPTCIGCSELILGESLCDFTRSLGPRMYLTNRLAEDSEKRCQVEDKHVLSGGCALRHWLGWC